MDCEAEEPSPGLALVAVEVGNVAALWENRTDEEEAAEAPLALDWMPRMKFCGPPLEVRRAAPRLDSFPRGAVGAPAAVVVGGALPKSGRTALGWELKSWEMRVEGSLASLLPRLSPSLPPSLPPPLTLGGFLPCPGPSTLPVKEKAVAK